MATNTTVVVLESTATTAAWAYGYFLLAVFAFIFIVVISIVSLDSFTRAHHQPIRTSVIVDDDGGPDPYTTARRPQQYVVSYE